MLAGIVANAKLLTEDQAGDRDPQFLPRIAGRAAWMGEVAAEPAGMSGGARGFMQSHGVITRRRRRTGRAPAK